jgi:hypothetical protein
LEVLKVLLIDADVFARIEDAGGHILLVRNRVDPDGDFEVAVARPAFKAALRAGFPTIWVYRATFDAADFASLTQDPYDGPLYVHFRIVPSRGDADSIRVSEAYADDNTWDTGESPPGEQPNVETMKIFTNAGETLDVPMYAVVDPTAADDNGTASTNITTAREDPFKTIYRAAQAIGSNQDFGVILLEEGNFWSDKAPDDTAGGDGNLSGATWLTVQPDEGVDREDVVITDVAFTLSSTEPLSPVFSIDNGNSFAIEYSWQTGTQGTETEGIRIRKVGGGFDQTISRNDKNAQQLMADIETALGGQNVGTTAIFSDPDHILVEQGELYYEPDTPFVTIAANSSGNILANSVCRTREGGTDVYLFSENHEETYVPASTDKVSDLVTALNGEAGFPNLTAALVQDIDLEDLKAVEQTIPAEYKEGQKVWFLGNVAGNGLRHPYVRYVDCTIRSTRLKANNPTGVPRHIWLDNCKIVNESKVSVDSSEIVAIPSSFKAGIWLTRCDWDTVNKSSNGPVMVRDALFNEVGGDTGKQVTYACNWIGTNVVEVSGDPVHPDFFQWSPTAHGEHGNIIALNLDFTDPDNDGQPLLFNKPTGVSPHQYRGIAFINYRANAARTQQFTSDCDHILVWHSDILQEADASRELHFRGYMATTPIAVHENLSVRNSVFERVKINASNQDNDAITGDVPSLWSVLDFCHIVSYLEDETGDDLDISNYFGCQDGGELDDMMDFPDGDWDPNIVFIPPALTGHLAVEDILYRTDAGGKERFINDSGAVGAMEGPAGDLGQPSENDTFDIATGTLSSGALADTILSDNTYLVGQSTTSGSFTLDVVVDAITSVASPATIDITVEASRGVAGGTANFRLKNWSTNNWDQVDSYSLGTTEIARTKTGVTASIDQIKIVVKN